MVKEAFSLSLTNPDHPVLNANATGNRRDSVWVGTNYPNDKAHYPGVWVDFTPNGALRSAGVGHVEYRDDDGTVRKGTRWVFSGTIYATIVSLSSHERDNLMDEVIRLVAFTYEHPHTTALRTHLESDDLITLEVQFDQMTLSGMTESQGTPWGTRDVVYEGTLSLACTGSFVSDLKSQATLVPISAINVEAYPDLGNGEDPFPSDPDGGWM